ncbi:MAG: hypothetical protein ACI8QZ_004076 [Chlamydiales bacterium]|jgi:hypothetical protein
MGPRPRIRSHVRTGALALALCAAAAGCRNAAVASANLDALHRADGKYHYKARQLSRMRVFMAQVLLASGMSPEDVLARQKEESIKNPARKTLEGVLVLADGPDQAVAPAGLRVQRVRQFAYLCCEDPSALVRERALIELGPIAAQADLGAPTPAAAHVANAPELSEAILGLAEVIKPMLASRKTVTATQRVDLEAACGLLAEMDFDVAGAHRILAVTAAVLDRRDEDGLFAPVAEFSAEVERSMIRQALARSLQDPVAHTRAAAVEANWRAYGDVFLSEAMRAVAGSAPADDSIFNMAPVWPGDEDVFLTVFGLIRDHGLPVASDDRAGRLQSLFILSTIAIDYSLFSDRTRNAAMLALGEVSGSGLHSLRLEDWQVWWDDFGVGEQAALRELEAERAEAQPES